MLKDLLEHASIKIDIRLSRRNTSHDFYEMCFDLTDEEERKHQKHMDKEISIGL
jgi:hypothetical protein